MREIIETFRSLYEADEHQWMLNQIELLEAGSYTGIDHPNLLVYLTEMTGSERRGLRSRMIVLVQHLLKFLMQPEKASRSWELTVLHQQQEIGFLFSDSPSLNRYSAALYAEAYSAAVRLAARETGIPVKSFPLQNPWTLEEALAAEPKPKDQFGGENQSTM